MKRYEKYKDSGIEWIGSIPEHWEVKKVGHYLKFSRGLPITKQNLRDKGIPCINYGEIHSKFGFSVNPEINTLRCVDEKYLETSEQSLLKRGDFIFADTSEDIEGSGNFTCLDSDVPTFAGYHTIIIRHKDINYKFLAFYFDSLEYRNQIRSEVYGIKVFSITQAILKKSSFILPPRIEQTAIANYLDRKTADLDQLIAEKEQLIKLYQEEKTAIINQAVTKGIHPNVALKDSGIEWLGDIPVHWEVKKLKYVVGLNDEALSEKEDESMIIKYIEIGSLKNQKINYKEYSFKNAPSRARRIVRTGDVIVSTVRTYLKAITQITECENEFIASTGFAVLRPRIIESKYLGYFCLSPFFINKTISDSVGVTYPAINATDILSFSIPLPPNSEQSQIVTFIEKESKRIDTKIKKAKKYINLLTEYRTALISEVVTGKIKVID